MNVPDGIPDEMMTDIAYLYSRFVAINEALENWGDSDRSAKIRSIETCLGELGTAYSLFRSVMNSLSIIDPFVDKKADRLKVARRGVFQQFCATRRNSAEILLADGLFPALVHRMQETLDCDPRTRNVPGIISLHQVKQKIQLQEIGCEMQKATAQRIAFHMRQFAKAEDIGMTEEGVDRFQTTCQIARDFEKCIRSLYQRIMQYCDDFAEEEIPQSPRKGKEKEKGEAWWNSNPDPDAAPGTAA